MVLRRLSSGQILDATMVNMAKGLDLSEKVEVKRSSPFTLTEVVDVSSTISSTDD